MYKDDYKKVMDQIHASDELKENTYRNIVTKKESKKSAYLKILYTCASVCTILLIVFSFRLINLRNEEEMITKEEHNQFAITNVKLPRFENIEELKNVLKESSSNYIVGDVVLAESAITTEDLTNLNNEESKSKEKDYSTTNVQVENIDEADIVKTDGDYIYYVTNNEVYIIDGKELEIKSIISINSDEERFHPSEIYVKENKIVILGNSYSYTVTQNNSDSEYYNSSFSYIENKIMAKAIVYNISNKEKPEIIREVALEGKYSDSRMIGENIYFISTKGVYYYEGIEDEQILPTIKDTAIKEENKRIDCTNIAYFEDTVGSMYTLIGAFNINNNKEVNVETFFGRNGITYCSEENLYITQNSYTSDSEKTNIYKFSLEDTEIRILCKGTVKGYLNNQFSMDEYEGNLRLATTINEYNYMEEEDTISVSIENQITTNNLYILNEKLEQIGIIENLGKDEKIYSVRFIGDIGYVVTFEQIDPLFVIDLSDPKNPEIKGELKIPGYSSYLHPYDETHIIGIGYNTKDNGYGGVTNSNMKMSMFDVSDLENPKEIFNIDIGNSYTDSDIIYNHKALFYNRSENLIGFPVTYREYNYIDDRNGLVIYKIDLENNKFEKYGEILQNIDYRTNIDRAIYVDDVLYTFSDTKIISYNLNTMEELKTLVINSTNKNVKYIDELYIEE